MTPGEMVGGGESRKSKGGGGGGGRDETEGSAGEVRLQLTRRHRTPDVSSHQGWFGSEDRQSWHSFWARKFRSVIQWTSMVVDVRFPFKRFRSVIQSGKVSRDSQANPHRLSTQPILPPPLPLIPEKNGKQKKFVTMAKSHQGGGGGGWLPAKRGKGQEGETAGNRMEEVQKLGSEFGAAGVTKSEMEFGMERG